MVGGVTVKNEKLSRDDFRLEVENLLAQLIADTAAASFTGRLPDPKVVTEKITVLAARHSSAG